MISNYRFKRKFHRIIERDKKPSVKKIGADFLKKVSGEEEKINSQQGKADKK